MRFIQAVRIAARGGEGAKAAPSHEYFYSCDEEGLWQVMNAFSLMSG